MNDEPVVVEFKRLLGEIRDLATEAEMKRCKRVAMAVFDACPRDAKYGEHIVAEIEHTKSAPAVQPPEPMTIARLIETLEGVGMTAGWYRGIEVDLAALVHQASQDQARRDADVVQQQLDDRHLGVLNAVRRALEECQEAILKSAGLE